MATDPFAQFKAVQRESWGLFAPLEALTTPAAAWLVDFAGVRNAEKVLDVACGTGVVAVTAARRGAMVKGLDLSPVLLERARWNANTAEVEVEFTEGDVEALPYPNESFDCVLSQFGHMFAPRPEVAVAEMLRVLKPGGSIAFSTWPPDLYTGRMFSLVSRYLPPPDGVAPPPKWGDPSVIRERLGAAVTDLFLEPRMLTPPMLSPQHFRQTMEATAGPLTKLVAMFKDDPKKLAELRGELEKLIASYAEGNVLKQHLLMTRARKRK
jgi:SAM-dependent methyltransferase